MRIPEHKIEEIRSAADIVDIVGGFVRLKKAGRNFVGLCPFHKEKTASFNVNPERGIFKCFGCGKGGDVIGFIMEMERISFVDAVQELAERYGIALEREKDERLHAREDVEALYRATQIAARYYFDTLHGPAGETGRQYFKKRGWTEETQRRFGLGYAPPGWSNVLEHGRAQGISDDILEQAGLVTRREGGAAYDRFRNRVMFPIIHVTRKVLGFGARALSRQEKAKYLNSPESAIYNKGRVLYGLSQASSEIREQDSVVLVEGYADVLSLSQVGIRNVVATSGTALTSEQVHILNRYTRNLFFLYDADSAGLNAMLRGMDVILAEDCDARIVRLPAGEDPDSYAMRHGADAVRERLGEAISFVDFVTERLKVEGKLDSPEGKAQAVHQIVAMLARMDDPIRREFYVHHLSQTYGLLEHLIHQQLNAAVRDKRRGALVQQSPPPEVVHDSDQRPPKEEVAFCSLLLLASNDVQIETLHALRINYIRDKRIRDILHLLLEQEEHEGRIDTDALWGCVQDDPSVRSLLADLLMQRDAISVKWQEHQTLQPVNERRALLDAWRHILLLRLQQRLKNAQSELRSANSAEDEHVFALEIQELYRLKGEVAAARDFSDLPDIDGDEESLFH